MIRLMLVGKKGVGKDTVAQIVRDVCGEPVVRRAFADMLKEDTRHIMEYVKRNFDVRGVSFDGIRPVLTRLRRMLRSSRFALSKLPRWQPCACHHPRR